jgi:hypothetical protein
MPSSAARVFLFLLLEDAQFFIDYTIQGQAVDLNSRSLLVYVITVQLQEIK